jgi:hypothetical protein
MVTEETCHHTKQRVEVPDDREYHSDHTISDIMEEDVVNVSVNDWSLRSFTVDYEKISGSTTGFDTHLLE